MRPQFAHVPWPIPAAQERRYDVLYAGALYRTVCLCGAPALVARPCGGKRPGSWAVGCVACAKRAFVSRSGLLHALYALGDELASTAADRRARILAALRQRGARTLAAIDFHVLPIQGKEKWIGDHNLGCIACGSATGAAARLDRFGRPFLWCNECRTFWYLYSNVSAELAVGAAAAVGAGDLDWTHLYSAGERVWSRWAAPQSEAAEATTNVRQEDREHGTVSG